MIASIALPLAHAGHWATSLLVVAPIVVGITLFGVQSVRNRRFRPDADAGSPDSPGEPVER